eukprot:4648650-Amphidinium_carterae.1
MTSLTGSSGCAANIVSPLRLCGAAFGRPWVMAFGLAAARLLGHAAAPGVNGVRGAVASL